MAAPALPVSSDELQGIDLNEFLLEPEFELSASDITDSFPSVDSTTAELLASSTSTITPPAEQLRQHLGIATDIIKYANELVSSYVDPPPRFADQWNLLVKTLIRSVCTVQSVRSGTPGLTLYLLDSVLASSEALEALAKLCTIHILPAARDFLVSKSLHLPQGFLKALAKLRVDEDVQEITYRPVNYLITTEEPRESKYDLGVYTGAAKDQVRRLTSEHTVAFSRVHAPHLQDDDPDKGKVEDARKKAMESKYLYREAANYKDYHYFCLADYTPLEQHSLLMKLLLSINETVLALRTGSLSEVLSSRDLAPLDDTEQAKRTYVLKIDSRTLVTEMRKAVPDLLVKSSKIQSMNRTAPILEAVCLRVWTKRHQDKLAANVKLLKSGALSERDFYIKTQADLGNKFGLGAIRARVIRNHGLYPSIDVWSPGDDKILREAYSACFETANSPFQAASFYKRVADVLPGHRLDKHISLRCQALGMIDREVLPEKITKKAGPAHGYRPCHEIVVSKGGFGGEGSMKWVSSLASIYGVLREVFRESSDPVTATRQDRLFNNIAAKFASRVKLLDPAKYIHRNRARQTVMEFAANRGITEPTMGVASKAPTWTSNLLKCMLEHLTDFTEPVTRTSELWAKVDAHLEDNGFTLPSKDGCKDFVRRFNLNEPPVPPTKGQGRGPSTILPAEAIDLYLKDFVSTTLPGIIQDADSNDDRCYLGSGGRLTIKDPRERLWGPSEMDIVSDVLLEDIIAQAENPELGPIKLSVIDRRILPRMRLLSHPISQRLRERWPKGFVPGHHWSLQDIKYKISKYFQFPASHRDTVANLNQNGRPYDKGWCWWRVQALLAARLRESSLASATTAEKLDYLKSLKYSVDCSEDLAVLKDAHKKQAAAQKDMDATAQDDEALDDNENGINEAAGSTAQAVGKKKRNAQPNTRNGRGTKRQKREPSRKTVKGPAKVVILEDSDSHDDAFVVGNEFNPEDDYVPAKQVGGAKKRNGRIHPPLGKAKNFEPCPADYTSLRLTQLPVTGGDTLWASGYDIFDRFSKPYQEFLEKLTATYIGDGFLKAEAEGRATLYKGERGSPANVGGELSAVHPLVRTNPVTGWKTLFSIGSFPKQINELNADESEELLRKFKDTITANHDLQVRFKWKNENDIAIWDNRSAFHDATFDYDGLGDRSGNRVVGIGERPYLDPKSLTKAEALAAVDV